ncbi:MAG: PEP-utilizing enzyme [Candidatus Woesearchaeota archaeon]
MKGKKSYRFMWGQKQSAMITEAMLNQIFTAKEAIFILSDGIFEHHMPEHEISNLKENGSRLLNKQYTQKLTEDIDEHIKDFFAFCDYINKKDLSESSNLELKDLFEIYRGHIKRTFIYFAVSTPQGTYFIEEEIKKLLMDKLQCKEKTEEFFIALSTPAEMDITMKERIDFLKIMKDNTINSKYNDINNNIKLKQIEKELKQYSRKYPALFFNTYDKREINNFLYNKLENKKSGEEIEREINKIKNHLGRIKNKHQRIYSIINDKNLEQYSTTLQKIGLDRYRLKHCWSGAEYLCLNMIIEVQQRLGIEFDDFIKTYIFTDIINFLDKKVRLSDKEIESRKKCMIFHYTEQDNNNQRIDQIYGKEAIDYKNRLITDKKDEQNNPYYTDNIKGMVANKGLGRYIKAKARVVNVKDLKQFNKDCKEFKKGEILVTTMTSPVMVPIIEKAFGIITDEGGICSHAAIISREFGIPCIVGTNGASFKIKTGDIIELDTNNGIIKVYPIWV